MFKGFKMESVIVSYYVFLGFLISVAIELSDAVKLDPSIGSNWQISSSTRDPTVQGVDGKDFSPQYFNYYRTKGNGDGSSGLGSNFAEEDAKLNHPQQALSASASESANVGKQFLQYYRHQPDVNSYAIYPASRPAEQRQEFLGGVPPFLGNILPVGGPVPLIGPVGDYGGDFGNDVGGSFFDSLPTLGGIVTAIMGAASKLAQSFGLGGLGLFGGLIVLAIGFPLVAFAVLFPAALIIVSILGFPVLQLTLPPTDPNLGRKLKVSVMDTARKAKDVLTSEECVERLSCGLARKMRKLPKESWILSKMDNSTNVWANRISKSIKTGRTAGQDCGQFKCELAVKLQTLYDSVQTQTR